MISKNTLAFWALNGNNNTVRLFAFINKTGKLFSNCYYILFKMKKQQLTKPKHQKRNIIFCSSRLW